MKFFIVGSGRCGSTLLTRMLNQHPDLFVFRETHWIPKLYDFFGPAPAHVEEMLDIVNRTRHVDGKETTPLSVEVLDHVRAAGPRLTVAAFAEQLASACAAAEGKTIAADKTPDYCGYMQMLQSLWPGTKFIHLIRDGAHAAQSMASHAGYRALVHRREISWIPLSFDAQDMRDTSPPASVEECLWLWRLRVARARAEVPSLAPNSYMELRFEALATAPAQVLSAIARFADLPDPEGDWVGTAAAMLDPRRVDKRKALGTDVNVDAQTEALMRSLNYGHSLPPAGASRS